jgi:arylsulfatase A-like enzyme
VQYQNGWRELYNLRRDPWEMDNIAGNAKTRPLQATLSQTLQRLHGAPPVPLR